MLLWNSRTKMNMTALIRRNLSTLHEYLSDPSNTWEEPIAFIIPRVPHIISTGDASNLGGGAHCDSLNLWFYIVWSDRIRSGLARKLTDPGFVHINCLEFVVLFLQLVGIAVRLASLSATEVASLFPSGMPHRPVLLVRTDNTSADSWIRKVAGSSIPSQNLVALYAAFLRTFQLGINSSHIPGVENELADFLSRPTDLTLSHSSRCEQVFRKHSCMRTWSFFRPSQELLQLLDSSLSSEPWQDLPKLPENLGQLEAGGYTTSLSPIL
jgi:hypothetical protein